MDMDSVTGTTGEQEPGDPCATDEVQATQPVGYWCGLTDATVTRLLRDAMAEIGVTRRSTGYSTA